LSAGLYEKVKTLEKKVEALEKKKEIRIDSVD